jgi:hypothetical protein
LTRNLRGNAAFRPVQERGISTILLCLAFRVLISRQHSQPDSLERSRSNPPLTWR